MPIPADTAGLALAIASGLLKLGQRIDDIAAEERATQRDLLIPNVPAVVPPHGAVMVRRLRRVLDETEGSEQPPQGSERQRLRALLDQDPPNEAGLVQAMQRWAPADLVFEVQDPTARGRRLLQDGRLWDLRDDEVRRVVYYVGPGGDLRRSSLGWKLAMALVDVVAELVVENQELVIKDQRARGIVAAILTRFSEGDLEDTVPDARSLLRHTLRSTLNGALDARDLLDADLDWLEAVLGALASARERAAVSDDFLVGLLRGKGYRVLVRSALEAGAGRLSRSEAKGYEKVLAEVLAEAGARLTDDTSNFRGFLEEHWTDLARAGLRGLHAQGTTLLDDEQPILRDTLLAVVGALAADTNRDLLGPDTLMAAVEAAVGAVAANPALLDDRQGPSWVRELVGSLTGVLQDRGVRGMMGAGALELVMREALETIGENPQLLVRDADLPQKVVGAVLRRLAQVEGPSLQALARAAVGGALEAVADNPRLLDVPYADAVGEVARGIAGRVRSGELSNAQAADLVEGVTLAIAANPELFVQAHEALAGAVVERVLGVAAADPARLLAGDAVVIVARDVLTALSARGRARLGDGDATRLVDDVAALLAAGLARASAELGVRLNRPGVPVACALLVDAWSRGNVPAVAPDSAEFQTMFAAIADQAMEVLA